MVPVSNWKRLLFPFMSAFHTRMIGSTAAVIALAASLGLSACSSRDAADTAAPPAAGDCPTAPINVVVSVDQWGDIVRDLGGDCADVTTVLASSSVEPHEFEPSPADAATFAKAQLVVVNGVDYDPWASKFAATSAPKAPVVDAGVVTRTAAGSNPHLWYDPSAVVAVADAVTAEFVKLVPEAKAYFDEQRAAFGTSLEPYDRLLNTIKAGAAGKTYAATESVFDYTAEYVGLVDKTPPGYQTASANESDPSPADLDAFRRTLADRQVDVLIYNSQTEGSVPEQIRSAAGAAGVPVVEVTETVPPGITSFQTWQIDQLTDLAKALGVAQ